MNILITGGAGFIGQHLTRFLLQKNISVTIIDNFLPQVHGGNRCLPRDLVDDVRLVEGDVADSVAINSALQGIDRIVHLAAETGTGQSMYEVSRYGRTNLQGTAQVFDCLVKNPRRNVDRIVVASSRALYGEGAYYCSLDGVVYPKSRSSLDKSKGTFDPICPKCSGRCTTIATSEDAPSQPMSFYGLTKSTQEQTVLLFGEVLGISSIALRYQNVFGPGQSLQNPYTGILAIFSNLAKEGRPINVFEDGMESRDFVYIQDVVTATANALLAPLTGCHTINVGSGQRTSISQVATEINAYFGGRSSIEVTGAFREGDIRHGFADLSRAQQLLGFHPSWTFEDGLQQFLRWAEDSKSSSDKYDHSLAEMRNRGLLRD